MGHLNGKLIRRSKYGFAGNKLSPVSSPHEPGMHGASPCKIRHELWSQKSRENLQQITGNLTVFASRSMQHVPSDSLHPNLIA